MKSFRKNPLSSVLAKVINVVWWLEWFSGATLIVMASITASVRRGFALQIPINFSTTTIRQARSVNKELESGIINTTDGVFSLHIDANWQNLAMLLFGFALIFSTIIIITYQLKKNPPEL
jgi:hypothetical protein